MLSASLAALLIVAPPPCDAFTGEGCPPPRPDQAGIPTCDAFTGENCPPPRPPEGPAPPPPPTPTSDFEDPEFIDEYDPALEFETLLPSLVVSNQVVRFLDQRGGPAAFGLDALIGTQGLYFGDDVGLLVGLRGGYGLLTNPRQRAHTGLLGLTLGVGDPSLVIGTYAPTFVGGNERGRGAFDDDADPRRLLGFRHGLGLGLGPGAVSLEVQHGMSWLGRDDAPRHELRAALSIDIALWVVFIGARQMNLFG